MHGSPVNEFCRRMARTVQRMFDEGALDEEAVWTLVMSMAGARRELVGDDDVSSGTHPALEAFLEGIK